MKKAVLGGGCFWCTESLFHKLRGIESVVSGYTGGSTKNPNYDQICCGDTGHAEAIEITYDPNIISYDTLLEVFFHVHDPTTLNRQGNDTGTQYRSAIFYDDPQEQEAAIAKIREIENRRLYPDPLVTQLEPLDTFYPAEEYHQNFFEKNPTQGYCMATIPPKFEKLTRHFPELLK